MRRFAAPGAQTLLGNSSVQALDEFKYASVIPEPACVPAHSSFLLAVGMSVSERCRTSADSGT